MELFHIIVGAGGECIHSGTFVDDKTLALEMGLSAIASAKMGGVRGEYTVEIRREYWHRDETKPAETLVIYDISEG